MPEYPTWRHYFDVVICAAQKPRFFQEGRPLMERDGDELTPVRGSLERGKIYEGGNLRDFERLVGVRGRACSTSAITSTATSCARRRKRRGAPR